MTMAAPLPLNGMAAPVGSHVTADLSGCDPAHAWMTDAHALRAACLHQVEAVGLQAVGERFHRFEPMPGQAQSGVTGVVLLAESHLAVHTWPERGVVTLDVFVCHLLSDNQARAQALLDALVAGFAPQHVHRQAMRRVIPTADSTD